MSEEEKKKLDIEKKKEEDAAKMSALDKKIGFIPEPRSRDNYRKNILWVLKKYAHRFDEDGRLKFNLKDVMNMFGSGKISAEAFMQTQGSKLDIINRNDEYPFILNCGKKGKDIDGNSIFYYQRGPRKDMKLFEEDYPNVDPVDTVPSSEGSEEEIMIGNKSFKKEELE